MLLPPTLVLMVWWTARLDTGSPEPVPAPAYTLGHLALLATYGEAYPIRPRLSGSGRDPEGASVAEAGSVLSFAGSAAGSRVLAEVEIERENQELDTPEAWAAAAARALLTGQADWAIGSLAAARLQRPDDVRILNDAAAAYLVRGEKDQSPLDLLEALALAGTAAHRDPRRPEPLFNRALALDMLHLGSAAAEAWADYLELDGPESTWAETARGRLDALRQPLLYERWEEVRLELARHAASGSRSSIRQAVADFPREALAEAEDWVFSKWSDAMLAGDGRAAKTTLTEIRELASSLPPEGGGALLGAVVEQIEAAEDENGRLPLAEAYRDLGRGIAAIERFEVQGAMEPLDRALGLLVKLNSPYSARALYLVAICRYQETRYQDAEQMLEESGALASAVADPATVAESLQLRAQVDFIHNRPAQALARQRSALAIFRDRGWNGQVASLESLHAEILGVLGDEERAWQYRMRSLASIGRVTKPRVRARIWEESTRAALDRDPNVAGFFADELVSAADDSALPLVYAVALQTRASMLAGQGATERALADLDGAEVWIDQLENRSIRDMLRGNLLRTRGELLAVVDPAAALPILNEATLLYQKTGFRGGLPMLLKARAHSHRQTSDLELAETDLSEAISELEAAGSEHLDPLAWESLLAEAHTAYDEMIDLQLTMGRPQEALSYSLRSLWEPGESPLHLSRPAIADLGRPLGSEGAIVRYHALPDRLLIWVIRGGTNMDWAEVAVGRSELKDRVNGLHSAFRIGGKANAAAEALYRVLIAPVEAQLDGSSDLVVLADTPLDRVPFRALRNPNSGRFVIQDRSVSIASSLPAAQQYFNLSSQETFDLSTSVLAVGNPSADPALELGSLPEAEQEVRKIAELFPRTTLLLREKATERAFLEGAQQHAILHYSGHAIGGHQGLLFSSLVLAPGDAEDGLLSAGDLLEHRLNGVRLAVVAGCGPRVRSSGSIGLARALLAAGVPTAVVSLWDVADRPTATLMERFYRALRETAGPAEALRSAQLELLASNDSLLSSPGTWGAFQVTWGRREEGRQPH